MKDAFAGTFQRGVESGSRRQPVPAAAELLGQAGDVQAGLRAEADLHAAARLLHEEQADLGARDTPSVVYKVFRVLGSSAAGLVIAESNFGIGRPSAVRHLQPVKDQSRQFE